MSVLKTRHRRSVYCRVTSSVSWWYREGVVMSLSIELNISVASITYYLVSTHSLWIPTKKISVYYSKSKHTHHFSAQLAMSSYLFQGHEGRSVQFAPCVKDEILYASSKLHTPAFITLELQSCAENVLILKSKHWSFFLRIR